MALTDDAKRHGLALALPDREGGFGAPGGTRTHDLQVRNLTLYPLSYGRTPKGGIPRRPDRRPTRGHAQALNDDPGQDASVAPMPPGRAASRKGLLPGEVPTEPTRRDGLEVLVVAEDDAAGLQWPRPRCHRRDRSPARPQVGDDIRVVLATSASTMSTSTTDVPGRLSFLPLWSRWLPRRKPARSSPRTCRPDDRHVDPLDDARVAPLELTVGGGIDAVAAQSQTSRSTSSRAAGLRADRPGRLDREVFIVAPRMQAPSRSQRIHATACTWSVGPTGAAGVLRGRATEGAGRGPDRDDGDDDRRSSTRRRSPGRPTCR